MKRDVILFLVFSIGLFLFFGFNFVSKTNAFCSSDDQCANDEACIYAFPVGTGTDGNCINFYTYYNSCLDPNGYAQGGGGWQTFPRYPGAWACIYPGCRFCDAAGDAYEIGYQFGNHFCWWDDQYYLNHGCNPDWCSAAQCNTTNHQCSLYVFQNGGGPYQTECNPATCGCQASCTLGYHGTCGFGCGQYQIAEPGAYCDPFGFETCCVQAPNCTTGPNTCGGFNACSGQGANTCTGGTQSQTCTHNGVQTCTPVNYPNSQACSYNNCSATYNPSGNPGPGCVCQTALGGTVYVDYDHDGVWDNSDVPLTGQTATVQISWVGGSTTTTTNPADGTWSIRAQSNTYTVTVSGPPAGYISTSSQQVTLGPQNTNVNVGVSPKNYSISGVVYVDSNESDHYDGSETPYSGTDSVTIAGPYNSSYYTTQTINSTSYSATNLLSGQYQVTHTPPAGYSRVYPNFPTYTVTVGLPGTTPSCYAGGYNDASCDPATGSILANGHLTGLNFGITNSIPAGTVDCADVRLDSGITVNIPSTWNCGGTVTPNYLQLSSLICPTIANADAGIGFSGNTDPLITGGGNLSSSGWQVGDSTYPEMFTSRIQNAITTSYEFLTSTVKDSGLVTTELNSVCNINACDLSTLANGIYTHTGDVIIAASHLTTNKVILLIKGNVTIDGKIIVDPGALDLFATTGDITIDPSVGEISTTSTTGDVEGLFTTDQSFIIASAFGTGQHCNVSSDPAVDGTSKDLKANIQGSIVTNAKSVNQAGGAYTDDRTLCKTNLLCPVDTIIARPDMLLNLPSLVLNTNNVFQEVAPGPGD